MISIEEGKIESNGVSAVDLMVLLRGKGFTGFDAAIRDNMAAAVYEEIPHPCKLNKQSEESSLCLFNTEIMR